MSVIENIEETETEEEREGFHIDSLGAANWAVAKLRYYRKRANEIAELHKAEQEKLDAWAKREHEKLAPHLDYFTQILTRWHEEQLAEDEKRKTITLPNGKLVSRKCAERVAIEDADAFTAVARELPENLVRVKYEPQKAELLKYIKETGELPAGVRVEPEYRTYRVEVDE